MRISGSIPSVGLAVFAFALGGCESQAQESESELRELTGFNAIHVSGGVDLQITQGSEFRVEITDGDPDDLVTEVSGEWLEIHPRGGLGGFFNWGSDHEVSVTLPALEALQAGGGSDVETSGVISGDKLLLVSSGGSDIEIRVAATTLEVEVSGGSDVELSGTADLAALQASGGSDLDGTGFRAREVRVHSSGGSDIVIGSVEQRLSGNASGGSDIVYSGSPQTVEVDTSGGSDISQR